MLNIDDIIKMFQFILIFIVLVNCFFFSSRLWICEKVKCIFLTRSTSKTCANKFIFVGQICVTRCAWIQFRAIYMIQKYASHFVCVLFRSKSLFQLSHFTFPSKLYEWFLWFSGEEKRRISSCSTQYNFLLLKIFDS